MSAYTCGCLRITTFNRAAPLGYTRPWLWDEVAIRYPELHMVLAHVGHPFSEECLVVIRKHPHVYADTKVRTASEQTRKWEEIKLKEKEHATRKSIVDGVPKAMPALSRASRVLSKAGKAKFQWASKKQAWAKFDEELGEFRRAAKSGNRRHAEEELGDVLMAFVNVARYEKLDPEHALHQGVKKLSRRIQGVEERAAKRGSDIGKLSLNEILALWKDVKKAEKKR